MKIKNILVFAFTTLCVMNYSNVYSAGIDDNESTKGYASTSDDVANQDDTQGYNESQVDLADPNKDAEEDEPRNVEVNVEISEDEPYNNYCFPCCRKK